MSHQPIMLDEIIQYLNIKPSGIYCDATGGRGGHTEAIVKQCVSGKVIVFDVDIEAIEAMKHRLKDYQDRIIFVHDSYAKIKDYCKQFNISYLDGFVFDLGVSSPQFDDAHRGFSYRFDAKLDMRMNQSQSLSAYHVVNEYDVKSLTKVLRDYGEEPYAYAIAKKIVKVRLENPVETTFQLVDIIKSALPAQVLRQKGHPAKQSFQAIRIEVNNELGALSTALWDATDLLTVKGRGCVLSFHSLEDRIVKECFKQLTSMPKTNRRIPQTETILDFKSLTKKPQLASSTELQLNPRAQSAKLRVIQRERRHTDGQED